MPIWQVLFLVNKWDRIMIGKKTMLVGWVASPNSNYFLGVAPPPDAGSWYMKGCLGWDSHLPNVFFHSDGSMACHSPLFRRGRTGKTHEWAGLSIISRSWNSKKPAF